MVLPELSDKVRNAPSLFPHSLPLSVLLELLSGFPAPMHRLRPRAVALPTQINRKLVLGGLISEWSPEDMVFLQIPPLATAEAVPLSHRYYPKASASHR